MPSEKETKEVPDVFWQEKSRTKLYVASAASISQYRR